MLPEMTLSAPDAAPLSVLWPGALGRPRANYRVSQASHATSRRILLSILLLLLIQGTSAQLDPVKNFCRRFGHQTALIDRKLYVDGGFINYNPLSQYPANYSNTGLQYHDLDTPGAGRMPQLYANLTKNSSIPSVSGGTLWADNINKRFYLFGGEYYQQPPSPQFTLWSYDTLYNRWDAVGQPAQDDIAAVSWGAGVSISETGEGYYYGGWKSNNTVPGWAGPPVAVSRLVKYSMDTDTWSTDVGPDSTGRAEGAMVFIPVGDGGMLVYFGGVQDPHGNGTWIGQPMETIFLYDVLSSKWYSQNATGTVPPMRRRFCAGATWAPDQSSYNVYLYGGAGISADIPGFDDVYALTIPSFQWVKMYPTDGNLTGEYPHHSLTCNIVDKAQMVIIGGTFPTSDMCDVPEQYGFHNADLGEQNREKALWQIYVTNLTEYAVPDPIVSAIGGSAGGGATKTAPPAGFASPDLRVLMTRKASIPTRTATRSITTATGSPGQGQENNNNNKPLSTGAIAGIAVGSAAAALALGIALFFIIRRLRDPNRRRRHLHRSHDNDNDNDDLPTTHQKHELPQGWNSPHAATSSVATTTTTAFAPGNGYHHPPRSPAELPVGSGGSFGGSGGGSGGEPGMPPRRTGSESSWLDLRREELGYELVPPPLALSSGHHHHHHPAAGVAGPAGLSGGGGGGSSTTDSGTGTGSGTGSSGEPQAKVDAEGRLWVRVSPGMGLGLGMGLGAGMGVGMGQIGGGGGGSPGGGGGDGGGALAQHHSRGGEPWRYSPVAVTAGLQMEGGLEPQELDCESRRKDGGFGLGEDGAGDGAHGPPKRHLTYYHP